MQWILYLPGYNLLRTHASNVQIRYMEENDPPPGLRFQGDIGVDTADFHHAAVFHQ